MTKPKRRGAEPDGKAGVMVRQMLLKGSRGCPPQHGLSKEQICKALVIGEAHAVDVMRGLVSAGYAVKVHLNDRTKRYLWCAPEHQEACEQYAASIRAREPVYTWEARVKATERITGQRAIYQLCDAVRNAPAGMTVPECCDAIKTSNRQTRKMLAELVAQGKLLRMHFGCKAKSLWFPPGKEAAVKARADAWLEAWERNHKYSVTNRLARRAADAARRRERERIKAETDEVIDPPIVRKWVRADTTYQPTGRLPANSVWEWGKQCKR
jgi:hypothetical protein